MSKPVFIRAVIARALPKVEKIDDAIDYAEAVWARLTARGYGDKSPAKPRESIDYYGALEGAVKTGFDRFWRAFARKGDDKQGAAKRWSQLDGAGELTAELIERIVAAAAEDAALPRAPDQVRCMARRWLYERRWAGYSIPDSEDPVAARKHRARELAGELAALKRLQIQAPYPGIDDHIASVKASLGELRHGTGDI
jgi:hypothetical protein